ncbi:MAG: hypothetical protein HOP15_11205 [Planctomycetes bacterium]|nr:hypothetical protein [Planctomycetota bacterium]
MSVVGLVLLFVWPRSEPGPWPLPERSESRSAAEEPGPSALAEPVWAQSSAQPSRLPTESPPSSAEPAEPALEVRVVDGPSGAIVPGAQVFLIDWAVEVRSRELDGPCADLDRILERLGQLRSADARGSACYPYPLGAATAAARHGESFAFAALDPAEPGPVVLTLVPDPPVRVRVVDAAGVPQSGVEVALRSAKRVGDFVCAATGADGTLELFAREHRVELVRDGARVALAVWLREPVEAPVDLEHVPLEPIELRLPPAGSVEVVLADEDGVESNEAVRVWAEPSTRMQAELGERVQGFRSTELWTRCGRARFWPVGLGLELRFGAEAEEREDRSVVAEGPTKPGEELEIRLELGAGYPCSPDESSIQAADRSGPAPCPSMHGVDAAAKAVPASWIPLAAYAPRSILPRPSIGSSSRSCRRRARRPGANSAIRACFQARPSSATSCSRRRPSSCRE